MTARHHIRHKWLIAISFCNVIYAQSPAPILASRATDAALAAVTKLIDVGDDASVAQAEEQIKYWGARGVVPMPLWRTWLPALMNYRRYQDVTDLSIAAAVERPGIDAIAPLLEFRVKALLALYKTQDALAAAKSYYNVCALKDSGNALDLIEKCLKTLHPIDGTPVAQFRAEQEAASSAAATGMYTMQTSPFLKSVHVDLRPYEKAIRDWSGRPDRVGYANLLLAADRGADAEAVFRQMYLSAMTTAQLTTAIDGIARSLRAEDGDVARADAWLLALQRAASSSSTEPAK